MNEIPATTDVKYRQHSDGTWDVYIYDAGNHRLLVHSNQHYENLNDAKATGWRVVHAGVTDTIHFTVVERT